MGLWPYHESLLVRFQRILFTGILASFIIFQIIPLITTKCTFEFIIKVFTGVMIGSLYMIYYNSFWINTHNIKCLLEQLQNICNGLKDENEIAIIEKYGNKIKYITIIFVSFGICCLGVILLLIWLQNTVLYKNGSQRQTVQFVTEYFVDKEKYFYLILLHINVAICIGVTTFIGGGLMQIGYIVCACGLFRIASYRIEQAMMINVVKNIHLENRTIIYKKIIDAIKIHRKAIKFTESLSSSFKGTYFLLGLISVICLSLNIFVMFRNASLENKEAFSIHLIYSFGVIAVLFVVNYAGQEITNHNNHVYSIAYNSRWYIAPLHAQKLLLFMLQRSNKSVNINIGGIFEPSLEYFATLTKASMTYCTVMFTVMQE